MIHATITITAADERALKDALMEARHALVVERKTFWLDSGKRWSVTTTRHGTPEPSKKETE
jgi:hypothetical protein